MYRLKSSNLIIKGIAFEKMFCILHCELTQLKYAVKNQFKLKLFYCKIQDISIEHVDKYY
jgi:hypothetical protein